MKSIIIGRLKGGLGNQLFQLRAFKKIHDDGYDIRIDCHTNFLFDKIYCRNNEVDNICSEIRRTSFLQACLFLLFEKLGFVQVFKNQDTFGEVEISRFRSRFAIIEGYWQNSRNLTFEFLNEVNIKAKKTASCTTEIRAMPRATIHLRDFKNLSEDHENLGTSYYKKVKEYLKNNSIENIIIYSQNEPNKEIVDIFQDINVSIVHSSRCLWFDFKEMANTDHFFLANSTYSLWSAYIASSLNAEIKVYSPGISYLKESNSWNQEKLLLPNWIVIEDD